MPDPFVIPDSFTPLTGYKIFKASSGKGRVTIQSLIYSHVIWQPLKEKKATCYLTKSELFKWVSALRPSLRSMKDHVAPEEKCSCGLYTLKNPYAVLGRFRMYIPEHKDVVVINTPASMEHYNEFYVMARMQVWGKVVVASDGYRSEYAKIDTVYVDDRYTFLAEAIWDQYKVPVESINTFAKHAWLR